MKLSDYNHMYSTKNKSILINYLNGRICIFKDSAHYELEKYFQGDITSDAIDEFLCDKGYLLEDDIDEKSMVSKIKNDIYEQEGILSLVFILTESCNLKCVYCCEEHLNTRMSLDLQNKVIQFVEENIYKYQCLKIEWFGGEPLLCMDIIEYLSEKFIEICKIRQVQYFAVISTNGYLLDVRNIKRLKNLHVFAYQITLDGLRETHDAQRMQVNGNGSWDIITNNLRSIRDHYKSNLISIIVRTNVTYPIYEAIDEYMLFLKKEFGEDKRFNFLWRIAEDWGRIAEDDKNILCGVNEYCDVMKKAGKLNLRNRFLSGTLKPGARACEATKKNSLIIFPTGVIGKCERNVSPESSHIGNIDGLIREPDKYLGKILERKVEEKDSCKKCKKFPICLGKACPFVLDIQCGYEVVNIDFLLDCILRCDDSCNVISEF